ncbi:NnrS family protein [Devosia nitrariae]|uniref:Short-chain dehydrogenase n=1 Tax=Devosia nitrariae TaxID=2071872 RepID=A0ABQ5W9Q6_9HYPH|nr:NnrS family protein [Devosia nitrariae]GLQ56613.1 short-chain dehydrogenase [Devosia nitrariae]
MATTDIADKRKPVPRGIASTGPALFSYGFRPFFLLAGIWAVAAMGLWIAALSGAAEVGGSYGAPAWHAHEMLFGYSSAALAGFLLTAAPNWTGRLPVSGWPLVGLVLVWIAGRLALLLPDELGIGPSITIDAAFLPLLLAICAREIIVGRKWKDLKVLAGLSALAIANIVFHLMVARGGDVAVANRLAVGAYVMLISIIGGRVVPSFTRNWLAKRHAISLPAPYAHFDTATLLTGVVALVLWVLLPGTPLTGAACALAGSLHAVRLARWQGWQTGAEALVLVLHVGYAFVPLGFLITGMAQFGWIEPVAALHVFTAGGIGVMTLAIMSRATRGHTGLELAASPTTGISYLLVLTAALSRPLTAILPELTQELLALSGICWMAGFGLYVLEYVPALTRRRRDRA